MSLPPKTINILGVTGSIGQAAMDVILANPGRFKVNVVSAHNNEQALHEAAEKLGAKRAVLTSKESLEDALDQPVDLTLCAIVGMAGLPSMMKALECSKAVAIANKEPLVAAGPLVIEAAKRHDTQLLPIDSEHNAIFQVFDFDQPKSIERIILTASGGPFLEWGLEQMATATPAQAIAHPNWSMGDKISVDSATMMNKALEIIEAHYLFDIPPEKIEVLIHPQSTVHSMVEYCDGSILCQMGASDMRTPIANVLAWPERLETPGERLDLAKMKELSFQTPDLQQFPALKLAYDCLKAGPYACVALNAANEVAVDAFLTNRIKFLDIVEKVDHILQSTEAKTLNSLEDIQEFDAMTRLMTQEQIEQNLPSGRATG